MLAYGYGERYKQITLPFLIGMGAVVLFELLLVFVLRGNEAEAVISKVAMGAFFSVFSVGFARESWKSILYIESVIGS